MPERGVETFEIELQNTLNHLYNPAYQPANSLFEVLQLAPAQGLEAVRAQILQVIREMNAPDTAPRGSKGSFLCQLLDYRFIQSLSQEKAAELLDISTRHFRRKQQEAIHALALKMLERQARAIQEEQDGLPRKSPELSRIEAIAKEIQVLTDIAPGVTAHLGDFLQRALSMAAFVDKDRSVELRVAEVAEDAEIPVHPSVLRQVVFYVILSLVQAEFAAPLELGAQQDGERTALYFRAGLPGAPAQVDLPGLEELILALGGHSETLSTQNTWQLKLIFPRRSKTKLLVIDDNPDQVYLYRKMLSMTAFEIIHLPGGEDLLAHIAEIRPGAILMDILLPGIDGWDLLWQIRQNSATAHIPVIICSVMGNDTMARSLGANGYLVKPVERKLLLQELEQFSQPPQALRPDSPA